MPPNDVAEGCATAHEMKVGIVSDVHNNVEALTYALAHMRDCDLVVSLGDLVSDYRVDPRIVRLARDASLLGIAGNHEKSILVHPGSRLRYSLSDDDLDYLRQLPPARELHVNGRRLRLAHGSPWDDPTDYRCEYVREWDSQALERAACDDSDVVLLGHTHVPMAVRIRSTLVLNPGSCGEARSRDGALTFGKLDTQAGIASVLVVEAGLEPRLLLQREL
jgi:putative phosphoesterase